MNSNNHLFDTYNRTNVRFIKGKGSWLFSEDGTPFLDFASGIAVNSLGHSHPALVSVLKSQADNLWHISNLYQSTAQDIFANNLAKNAFDGKVFFTNSGSESVECAIKTARRYHYMRGNKNKFRIITFEGAFHGRTLATIAAGGKPQYLEGFGPKAEGFDQVKFADLKSLEKCISKDTAAILIEPIQGEGGVRKAPIEFLRKLREICNSIDALLILDEVQTGCGRTGKLFAYEWSNITPDIMALAKGLGGGFPVGACLAKTEVAKYMNVGSHGSTYGGNALAMVTGNKVLDIIQCKDVLENVCNISKILFEGLQNIKNRFPNILLEVRGQGLLIGLKTVFHPNIMANKMQSECLLVAPASDNVVRITPPLNVTAEEINEGLKRITRAIKE
ncbi:aspartate aminotransferase family protein [Candidatus Liberibacter americanus]|uniref:Ornithine/acetylornithine aminotransferase n=1 Tax=Candidatus Liberibacter americanus str. Sao Paulo TaxID=1261131 RepID=U6B306_9HYPH|nr:aspartate aminotransferase family protein [Candidatus Liberibacter americanus]AHA27444.1 Ornithine/acetylornithine aminotransferase [Candidatus Liberibacter americanus str. Sao Paulo]EMS36717.1 acetylornithine transaminase protein [Candidatus Liberibacter americanus PW_SP]